MNTSSSFNRGGGSVAKGRTGRFKEKFAGIKCSGLCAFDKVNAFKKDFSFIVEGLGEIPDWVFTGSGGFKGRGGGVILERGGLKTWHLTSP